MPDADQDDQLALAQILIKAPAFMESAVPGWFTIIESQFHLRNITTQTTKFFNVISSLPADLVAKLPTTVLADKNYESLKTTVIDIYEKTKPELFEKLISSSGTKPMTGRPSLYLRELQVLGVKIGVGEDIIRHKFVQALPANIAPALAAQKDLTLTQIGNLADELMPLSKQHEPVPAYIQAIPQPTKTQPVYNSQSSTPSNIPYGLRPYNPDQRPRVCKSHIYFGVRAKTCKPWCEWPDKTSCRLQPSSRPASPARGFERTQSNERNTNKSPSEN